MLKLALGYTTRHRNSVPVVLYIGRLAGDMQKAIDAAPASIARIEVGSFHYVSPGKRRASAPAEQSEDDSVQEVTVDQAIALLEADRDQLQARLIEAVAEIERLRTEIATLTNLLAPAQVASPAIHTTAPATGSETADTDPVASSQPAAPVAPSTPEPTGVEELQESELPDDDGDDQEEAGPTLDLPGAGKPKRRK